MDAQLREIIQQVPLLAGRDARARLLSGGLTNRNYRIDAEGESFVVRIPGDNSTLLGIDRDAEHACSRAAAEAGVGAEVVGFVTEHAALVTRFVEGRVLQPGDSGQPELIGRVAAALRRLHEQAPPAGIGTFSPFATVRDYYALARQKGVEFPPEMGRALALLARVEQGLATDEPHCLCHNDLLPGNFIDDGRSLSIIDWDYGGLGDRFFDLGNLAVNHHFDDDAERELLAHYFGELRPDDLRRLRLMRLASDMREALWGYLQAGISQLDFDYYGYAHSHLERFLTKCRESELAQ